VRLLGPIRHQEVAFVLILEVFRQRQLRIEYRSAYVRRADLVVASLFVLLGHVMPPSEVMAQASFPRGARFTPRRWPSTASTSLEIDAAFSHWHTARRR
jgi:hypothetical protein